MVDFRPLLFINALALMLLVTAGFASVRKDIMVPVASALEIQGVIAKASAEPAPAEDDKPEPEPEPEQPLTAETVTIDPVPEEPESLVIVDPVGAIAATGDVAATA